MVNKFMVLTYIYEFKDRTLISEEKNGKGERKAQKKDENRREKGDEKLRNRRRMRGVEKRSWRL